MCHVGRDEKKKKEKRKRRVSGLEKKCSVMVTLTNLRSAKEAGSKYKKQEGTIIMGIYV